MNQYWRFPSFWIRRLTYDWSNCNFGFLFFSLFLIEWGNSNWISASMLRFWIFLVLGFSNYGSLDIKMFDCLTNFVWLLWKNWTDSDDHFVLFKKTILFHRIEWRNNNWISFSTDWKYFKMILALKFIHDFILKCIFLWVDENNQFCSCFKLLQFWFTKHKNVHMTAWLILVGHVGKLKIMHSSKHFDGY